MMMRMMKTTTRTMKNKPRIYRGQVQGGFVWVVRWFDGSGSWTLHNTWADAMRAVPLMGPWFYEGRKIVG